MFDRVWSDRLAAVAAGRTGPVVIAGLACLFDVAKRGLDTNLLAAGLLDEPAHLATAALGLLLIGCFVDASRGFYFAALVASVAIDLDHIPGYLGLSEPHGRPVTHSLTTVAVFAGAAAASRRHRAVLTGAAAGLVFHFARDISEGPSGVRMLWPVQQTVWTADYKVWLGLVVVLTGTRLILVTTRAPLQRVQIFQPRDRERL